MLDLERDLADLAAFIAWPATPRLKVRATKGFPWSRALALAAAVLLVVAALIAYTPTREAIAGFLNLHTTVNRVPVVQTPSPGPGQALGLGTLTTLSAAQDRLGWRIVVPPALGQPNAIYIALPPSGPSGGEVTLVYTQHPGIKPSGQTGVSVLLTEARGTVNEQFFAKTVGPDATIETVQVNGHRGWWISGAPHVFVFTDANGNPYFDTLRLATNTLIVDDGGTVVRIEGEMTKALALQLAGSL